MDKKKNLKQEQCKQQKDSINLEMLEHQMKQGRSEGEQESDSETVLSKKTIEQIFDKVFKKILTLSGRAVVNLINGLFETDYPLDSQVTYNWTEFEDETLKRRLADTILTINGRFSYHMEAQVTNDGMIVFRVFDYGYGYAQQKRVRDDDRYVLRFPKPVIIYLYYEGNIPDEYTLTLEFDEGRDSYQYKVPVVKLQDLTAEEVNRRKMVILIPFHLLKLKTWLKQGKVTDELLRKLIYDDIIGSIDQNRQLGNISQEDSMKLKRYTRRLGEYLYAKLQGEGLEVLQDMTDESFMTDVDIFFEEYHEKERILEEQSKMLAEQDAALKEKDVTLKEQKEAFKKQEREIKRKRVLQVCRNYEKGKSPETIAEDLLEPLDVVRKICDICNSIGEEYHPEEVVNRYLKST